MKFILFIFVALFSGSVMADDLIIENLSSDCGNAYSYSAIYEVNTYVCAAGTYLPAGAIECETCPDGYVCNGGVFNFSAIETQGVNAGDILLTDAVGSCGADEFNQSFSAIYEANIYDCAYGYYLPAGNDWLTDTQGCTKCTNDNYCAGGTFTFSETVDQGLSPCPDAHPFAPAGMWLESQCGRKLHIGDNVLYVHQSPAVPTKHRLYVRYGNTKYSANIVPTPDGVVAPNMSVDATRSLRVLMDGVGYGVCDDSVCPNTVE